MPRQWIYFVMAKNQPARPVAAFDCYGSAVDYIHQKTKSQRLLLYVDMLPLNVVEFDRCPDSPESTLTYETQETTNCFSWIPKFWK